MHPDPAFYFETIVRALKFEVMGDVLEKIGKAPDSCRRDDSDDRPEVFLIGESPGLQMECVDALSDR